MLDQFSIGIYNKHRDLFSDLEEEESKSQHAKCQITSRHHDKHQANLLVTDCLFITMTLYQARK